MSLSEIIAALREGRITADEAEAQISELSYIDACELVGPNDMEFGALWDKIEEEYRLQL